MPEPKIRGFVGVPVTTRCTVTGVPTGGKFAPVTVSEPGFSAATLGVFAVNVGPGKVTNGFGESAHEPCGNTTRIVAVLVVFGQMRASGATVAIVVFDVTVPGRSIAAWLPSAKIRSADCQRTSTCTPVGPKLVPVITRAPGSASRSRRPRSR